MKCQSNSTDDENAGKRQNVDEISTNNCSTTRHDADVVITAQLTQTARVHATQIQELLTISTRTV